MPTDEQVCAFLAEPAGERQTRDFAGGVSMAVCATATNHLVESRTGNELLHRTWLAK